MNPLPTGFDAGNMTARSYQGILLGLALVLAGCGAGAGGSSGALDVPSEANEFCHTIPALEIRCESCAQVTNTGAAFDGQFATSASIGPGGQGSFLGQSVEQAAGSFASVYFVLPDPAGATITLTTFLDGVQQETSAPVTRQTPSDNCSGVMMSCSFNDGAGSFVGMGTTKPYDAIQATISNSSVGTLEVSELCVR